MEKSKKFLVGGIERCDLPELNIQDLEVRVDTGAQTSSLHVDNITPEKRDGESWINFDIHPDVHNVTKVVRRSAKVKQRRSVKSSNSGKEKRYVIETELCLGPERWNIELTLTDRSGMTYLMLLGREAMKDRIIVDPSEEFLLDRTD